MKLLHRLRSDEALMSAFQQGDSHAFEVLYKRHKDRLLRFLLGIGRSSGLTRERAEELAQDSWASIIQSVENYRIEAKFSTYLFTVGRNRWIDETRRQNVRTDVDAKISLPSPYNSIDDDVAPLTEKETLVEGMMEVAVDHQRVLQAIDQLPEEQRTVFLLKEAGFSLKEISLQLNQPSETIKSRIRYARSRLRERFSEQQELTEVTEASL